jgi:hypothetical protein
MARAREPTATAAPDGETPPVDATPLAPPPLDDPPSVPPPVGPALPAPETLCPLGRPDEGALEGVGDGEVDPGLRPSGGNGDVNGLVGIGRVNGLVGIGRVNGLVGIGRVNGLVGIGRSEPDDMGAGVDGGAVELGRGVGATVGFGVGVGAAMVSETVAQDDHAMPSNARYRNIAVPVNPPPGE